MHITGFSIRRVPPIENILVHCDERVNLFVGPNATGKSTILRSISGLYSTKLDASVSTAELGSTDRVDEVEINGNEGLVAVWVSADWPSSESVRRMYIPASRINIGLIPSGDYISSFVSPFTMSYEEALNGTYLQRAIDALHGEVPGADMEYALRHAFRCAQSICREIIKDGPYPYLETGYDEKQGRSVDIHHAMGVGTIDDVRGDPLHAGVLSSGTQGTLLWIYALAIELAGHYEFEVGWEEKPVVLLIDEIENHLHPTWQRRVIPALLKHFPGLQIFATTHSPFAVAGLKAGQVHLLSRDEKTGVVTATTNTEDIIGWTADEILRTMMDVDDPTDDATAAAAAELRKLRQEGPRDTLEAEAQRQQRMVELRRSVDRDLLAGGPEAAQREFFEQQFEEALEKYRQSQSLNQENG